jgi:hypothetical protein
MTEDNWLSKCEWKKLKEIIDESKEIGQEESRRILDLEKTRTVPSAIIKKGQNNKVILMGVGMQINNNSSRSSTTEESTYSKDNSGTSSRMRSTEEDSSRAVTLTHPTRLTSSSRMNSPVDISIARNNQVKQVRNPSR